MWLLATLLDSWASEYLAVRGDSGELGYLQISYGQSLDEECSWHPTPACAGAELILETRGSPDGW